MQSPNIPHDPPLQGALRKTYGKPQLQVYGHLPDLTQGAFTMNASDSGMSSNRTS